MINFNMFQEIIQKMGIVVTKKVAKKYFELLAGGKDKLDVSIIIDH